MSAVGGLATYASSYVTLDAYAEFAASESIGELLTSGAILGASFGPLALSATVAVGAGILAYDQLS